MNERLADLKNRLINQPLERVPFAMKSRIESVADLHFDVHCHFFTLYSVPDHFLGIRIPLTRRFLDFLKKNLHRLWPCSDEDALSNLAYFIEIGENNSESEIAAKLFEYYPETTICCPLLMDMRQAIKGEQRISYEQQMEAMITLRDAFPNRLLPFVCIDPNNEKALELFIRAFSGSAPFFGLKIYPSLGYLPSHPLLLDLFAVCEEKRIPVTAHCYDATVRPSRLRLTNIKGTRVRFHKPTEAPRKKWFFTKRQIAAFFNHPKNWAPVLKMFPGLKLNLAHFGGPEELIKWQEGQRSVWVGYVLNLMEKYAGVYTDLSFTLAENRIFDHLRKKMEDNRLLRERVLFGSDYYMVVTKGHFRMIYSDFATAMGDDLMQQITRINPRKFLFGV